MTSKLQNSLYVTAGAVLLFALPFVAAASFHRGTAPGGGCEAGRLCNPLEADTLTEFLVQVLGALQLIVFPFVVLFLVYGGFLFVTAQGNSEKLNNAKKVFLWTLIGALIILGAEVLSRAIDATVDELRGASVTPHVVLDESLSQSHPLYVLS